MANLDTYVPLNRLKITVLPLLAVMALLGCSDSSTEPDILINKVYMPTDMEVRAGARFGVPVRFENETPISALTVPLSYSTEHVDCDSISFVGSRVAEWDFNWSYIEDEERKLLIAVLDDSSTVKAGRGLLATIYFRAHGDSPDVDLLIEETWISQNTQLHYTDASDTAGPIIPAFVPGKVHIEEVP